MFRLTVADVFVIRGRGLVATGRVEDGAVRVGDEVDIGGRLRARVDGIEAFRKVLDQAQVGDNVGLLFAKLDKGDVNAGDVVSGAGVAVGAMPPAPPPPPTSTRDPRFAQVEQQRTQLLSMREAGVMTTEQIDAALRDLMFAVDGRHWILNAGSDAWYSSDGRPWKQDTPPS